VKIWSSRGYSGVLGLQKRREWEIIPQSYKGKYGGFCITVELKYTSLIPYSNINLSSPGSSEYWCSRIRGEVSHDSPSVVLSVLQYYNYRGRVWRISYNYNIEIHFTDTDCKIQNISFWKFWRCWTPDSWRSTRILLPWYFRRCSTTTTEGECGGFCITVELKYASLIPRSHIQRTSEPHSPEFCGVKILEFGNEPPMLEFQ